jgi:mRNA-degrading endonuclease RelE of RelBE toxin-antitoxin system
MQLLRAERFKKDFKRLPTAIQERTGKALELFLSNSRHPSLHVKKMEGAPSIWELRVSDNYRITFQFVQEGVLLRRVGTHHVLRQP